VARALRLWGPVAATMAGIFFVSSLHRAPLPPEVSDKSAHTLGYIVLGVTVVRALAGGLPARVTAAVALGAVAITVAYGATDEWHQSFVAGRSSDIADLYADALGAVIAAAGCWACGILFSRPVLPGRSS
jgi:VanZ family protein